MRPHDLELSGSRPRRRASRATVSRVVRVGFEVRVEVATADQVVLVTLTRTQFQALGLEAGSPAWVRPAPGAPTVVATGGAAADAGEDELVGTAPGEI